MLDKLSWKTLLAELLLCCVPALLLGALFGYWPWFLLLALCLLWLWQGWNQLRLSHWLWVDRSMTPPEWARQLGALVLWAVSDAAAQSAAAS